ncbi:MAG TPA: glycosyltransferase [Planctomycetota bacterium]|nr:glycosyltransferase [Planctomycetota bacterium]
MRILLVSHGYPPRRSAGTENYTQDLARRLTEHGHRVRVFAAAKDIAQRHLSTEESERDGVGVLEVFNNLHLDTFRETWELPAVEELFARELAEHPPDLVHVQHLLYLSCGLPRLARERGIPVLFTLHDFWLQCPRLGQRVHGDGSRCDEVDLERCGSCLARFKFSQSSGERLVGGAAAHISAGLGLDLGPFLRRVGGRGRRRSRSSWSEPPAADRERRTAQATARARALREELVPAVELFLSPSPFLREELIAWGIPAERIRYLPAGIDRALFPGPPDSNPAAGGAAPDAGPAAGLRRCAADRRLGVGFLGTLVPLKGAHLLLEAWARLPAELRAGAALELRGPREHESAYQAQLDALAREAGASIAAPLARAEVGAWIASRDFLVLPSLWFENAPLVIQEARAMGTPVLVSDLGGMAELVPDPTWRFPVGDGEALGQRLVELLACSAAGECPPASDGPEPTDQGEHVARLEELYRAALGSSAP